MQLLSVTFLRAQESAVLLGTFISPVIPLKMECKSITWPLLTCREETVHHNILKTGSFSFLQIPKKQSNHLCGLQDEGASCCVMASAAF